MRLLLFTDHKSVEEEEEHPLRPVCGANKGPGARISNILSNIISPCNEAVASESQVESTEDLQASIEELNNMREEDREGMVIFHGCEGPIPEHSC